MSIYRPNAKTQQAIRRQKIALSARLRFNLRLKVVSIAAAVCLYVFVQGEHNPTLSRDFSADVKYLQLPPETDVDTIQRNVSFTITGPRSLLDRLREGDIHAIINLHGRPLNKVQTATLLTPSIPKFSQSQFNQLNIDQSGGAFKFRLVPIISRSKAAVIDLKSPPIGYHYGKPILQPNEVTLTGWAERVMLVERVLVDYKPSEDGKIKGMFPVLLLDHEDNPIDNVTPTPAMINVSVPLLLDPLSRLVTISADLGPLPLPPWNCESAEVTPPRVKISGTKELVNRLFTLSTERISLLNETQSSEITVKLVIPEGLTVQDSDGKTIDRVKVHIVIRKSVPPPRSSNDPPDLPPVNPKG